MKTYQHILLAVELIPESDKLIIEKTKELLALSHAKLSLIHGIEHFANFGAAYNMPGGLDVEEEILASAKETLKKIAESLQVAAEHIIVKSGSAKHIIVDEAQNIKADLIIVGSHGRHGVGLLLGSTANAVIHAAKSDVLAVRLK
ncbi:MAG: universal stress protein UspA [Gammaproteobacteria bacterium RIFCSPHIGHO2_12_FULL_40_19]|nr:MAG: universal stress protein UspA [Gammaproteobacteria bacterium RIFCSPHIGHO2_12_FULL_40_19]